MIFGCESNESNFGGKKRSLVRSPKVCGQQFQMDISFLSMLLSMITTVKQPKSFFSSYIFVSPWQLKPSKIFNLFGQRYHYQRFYTEFSTTIDLSKRKKETCAQINHLKNEMFECLLWFSNGGFINKDCQHTFQSMDCLEKKKITFVGWLLILELPINCCWWSKILYHIHFPSLPTIILSKFVARPKYFSYLSVRKLFFCFRSV